MKKVSVIIPFYNQDEVLLEQAIISVQEQNLDDIEIICIDDGSENKNCINSLKKAKKKDSRIIVIETKHTGSGNARNIGINISNSENIMFLDSDDYYPDNNVINKLYNLKKENNVLIAGGKHLILNNNNLEEPYFNYGDINEYFCNKIIKYSDYQFPWWYWCFLFDSELIKSNKLYFPLYLRYQDPPFFVRVMNKAQNFYAADFISYIHRNSNKLFSLTPETIKDHVTGIADLLEYSKLENLKKLHSLLYNTFFSYDINLFDNIKDLSSEQKQEMINLINKYQIIN